MLWLSAADLGEMTFDGFVNWITSKDTDAFNPVERHIHQVRNKDREEIKKGGSTIDGLDRTTDVLLPPFRNSFHTYSRSLLW